MQRKWVCLVIFSVISALTRGPRATADNRVKKKLLKLSFGFHRKKKDGHVW